MILNCSSKVSVLRIPVPNLPLIAKLQSLSILRELLTGYKLETLTLTP